MLEIIFLLIGESNVIITANQIRMIWSHKLITWVILRNIIGSLTTIKRIFKLNLSELTKYAIISFYEWKHYIGVENSVDCNRPVIVYISPQENYAMICFYQWKHYIGVENSDNRNRLGFFWLCWLWKWKKLFIIVFFIFIRIFFLYSLQM